ncbi:unnamed protein product [Brassica rapa]|uniref:Zinc finger PHD-type domain-containing protein n=1 Tax=Brassica campestris TaxID=3711 RepID=A0A3P6C073_BRACM|nr:unnamed protein product [Brassica rapa]VDD01259.1 unnamed protein product [Brassica rapa]
MDLIQHSPTVIVCTRPRYRNKEEFRSARFKDSPIVLFGFPGLENDKESPPSDNTHPLVWCHNEENKDKEFPCNFCERQLDSTTGYYLCEEFDKRISKNNTVGFHKECIKPMTNNPYHPKHPLQVLVFATVVPNKVCYCCYTYKTHFYYCFICNFSICRDCARKPLLLTIDHKKRHEHTLYYIPREASMTCDVCALHDRRYFIYVCHQCDYVVHKKCIYSPYVIKISRHEHRLSFTSSFLSGEWFCGICRKKINQNYGGYSCVKGCYYVAHSQCAIHKDVWDGKELEGEPEEIFESIMPFEEISDGIIKHFSHKHHMRLLKEVEKTNKINKHCQACAFRIYEGDIYNCLECDFVLHKVCAYLPVKKQHVLHPHPLFLQEENLQTTFGCSACFRVCNNFRYVCQMANCLFTLDVNCAAVSVPLNHQCHPHLLFLPSQPGSERICSICKKTEKIRLECGECDFVFCFRCAILPMKFKYQHDEHPLIFSYEEDSNGQHWCDVCEKEILPKNGIYTCNDCDIQLHIECLHGNNMYLLPCKSVILNEGKYDILCNDLPTRYTCKRCHKRCEDKTVYKRSDDVIYCSMYCIKEPYMVALRSTVPREAVTVLGSSKLLDTRAARIACVPSKVSERTKTIKTIKDIVFGEI